MGIAQFGLHFFPPQIFSMVGGYVGRLLPLKTRRSIQILEL
jgi:hypothetical protein